MLQFVGRKELDVTATEEQLLPGLQSRGLTSLELCDYETVKRL